MTSEPDDRPSVLLVDDRPENLITLEAVLRPLDLQLVRAGSGEDALRSLLEQDFAVVLLDVQMPGMDGFETASYIRRRPRSRLTPIIFLSAVSTDLSHVMRGYEVGAVDYVLKPYDPLVLRSKVAVFAELELERRARQRSESLLLGAMRSSPNGLIIARADGTVVHANPAVADLLGHGPGPIAGGSLGGVLGLGAGHAVVRALLGLSRRPGARYETELELRPGLPVRLVASLAVQDDPHLLVELWDLRSRVAVEEARLALLTEQAARAKAEALYEREHDIASTLQRGLLPSRLPPTAGLTLSSHFEAGGEGTQVGGDWFDAFPLPGGRVGLIVGDVSGRGVDAAARMGQLRSVARAYALEGHPPVEVVARLNAYHQGLAPDDLTTLVYAVVEPDVGRVRIVNAGHPPPAIALPDSSPTLVEGGCPALGVTEVSNCVEQVRPFPPGAVLVLYTDGLVEHRSEGTDEGLARLLSALTPGTGDIEALCRRVLASCGPAAGDDVTVLCARADRTLGDEVALTLLPEPSGIAAARRLLRRWLGEHAVDAEESAGLVLAANEAWQNAIEHGHGFAERPVSVSFRLEDGEVVITVRDAGGRGTPPGDPDRGRGIELMRAHTDTLDLDLGTERGGLVVLRRRVRAADGVR
ncbi:SpoIIE family protein phosphatase [Paraconexibacter antarcticus]|uniref:SpoIIE family protein phosphatase n=1 Tax=Paraconexibacter antarcticus TaxID=2949664 RepID=A0ABY5DLX6_9ACTN|nr:SpoIIE family protein phosphatase [Paraconexibacter antarcticus]UTI62335.1 SpoIIE family protein phosphatase [Paraconexibacter antarcticus]